MTEGVETAAGGEPIPSGIVTFLFTDAEGSTRLRAEDRDAMAASLQTHDEILRREFEFPRKWSAAAGDELLHNSGQL